ncbi:cell division protein FtsZ [Sanyastnella coralliicola]|uniref:cell division protein FtsZ n=1 Tax=Sanyastnella coralliicola TaxID=3069118 RepID=UPI0027B9E2B5|nr:cell division protein FtsZ [Longitalea sp. SCSIO 12813]
MENQNFEPMRFDLPKEQSSIIKVIGVGGGGSNAVNYMYEQGIKGVDFMVCNTDAQALDASPVPVKIQLGETLTQGRGAGSLPEVGRNAAVENLEDVKAIIGENTTMVFVTAGMGGGTGTGAAPVIARAAKEMGILTVGIVTIPFIFEGRRRSQQADSGLEEMRDAVDTLLVIKNDKLRELFGNLPLKKAFDHADEVLCTAAKGIAEVITLTGQINVDMNDVNTVMRDSGVAIMGSGRASGDGRAMFAVEQALESPLLNDNDITGANFVLLNITHGSEEVLMDEISEITDYIQDRAGSTAEVIWGYGPDEALGSDLCVTVIATGFSQNDIDAGIPQKPVEVKKFDLPMDNVKEVTQKVDKPTSNNEPFIVEQPKAEEPFLVKPTPEPTPAPEPAAPTNEDEVIRHTLEETTQEEEWEAPANDQPMLFEVESPITASQEPVAPIQEEEPAPANDALKFEPETPEETHYFTLDGAEVTKDELLSTSPTDSVQFTDELSVTPEQEEPTANEGQDAQPTREELMMRNREREQRIREISMKLKTPSGLSDLESEPAFVRRQINLDNTPHSSDSTVSKFSLGEEEDENGKRRAQLRDDNSFLHNNVD